MARNKKASMIKKIRERGGYGPKEATANELSVLANNLRIGKGWVVRVHRPPSAPFPSLNKGETYWIPNSHFATDLVQTNLVFTITRTEEPPVGSTYLAIPPDWGSEEE